MSFPRLDGAIHVTVDDNPNSVSSGQFVFKEMGAPKNVHAIRVEERGREIECDVIGVDEGGKWIGAQAMKIADSGEAFAFLIFGGAWGIRLRPETHKKEAWDLANAHQWGEPFKIYGSESDILYGNS